MEAAVQISPSTPARSLFGLIVARASRGGVLSMEDAMQLSIERMQLATDSQLVGELVDEGWLEHRSDGGLFVAL